MTSHETTPTRRNARLKRLLLLIDVAIGAAGMGAGVIVFLAPPPSFIQNVAIPWLVIFWGVCLFAGGAASVVGRLTGFWLGETIGISALSTGAAIYVITVATAGIQHNELGTFVAVALIIVAVLAMLHRYVELQIFTSEARPGEKFWERLKLVLRLRTR